MPAPLRLAMWSGPRNLSTAMMRSWGNRPDTVVCDEPLYAHYLKVTGKPHPGADEVLCTGETDWRRVVAWLTGPVPDGKAVFFQKHMTHHLLPNIDRAWLADLTHVFLIRDPREVITSYLAKHDALELEDLGVVQQRELFDWVQANERQAPLVVDARDVQENPRRTLGLLCEALGVPFSDRMLSWPPGYRETDGVWAKHWYREVVESTGFREYRPKPAEVPKALEPIYRQALAVHEPMHALRIH